MNGFFSCEGKGETEIIRREAFSSYPDKVFVYFLEDISEEGMQLVISFDGGRNPFRVRCDGNQLSETRALESVHSDGTRGMTWDSESVRAGRTGKSGNRYSFLENAHRAVLYIRAVETDFATTKETIRENRKLMQTPVQTELLRNMRS